ncbi:lipopolysaccharide-induced tumor necrosis factor-alpha factor homolog [Galleria mellonella]|uniref:Lipopolysaccharide-induced tumor necrosis factor-alpha factor homolog n=1 Tax=Galleria mellonella TaxID=7137 RepID=A0A6J1X953_GALME|nr:lipopolysaccharide-induced tumor necrosis factor-alpha factor homolog [Galleria mellonella]
MESNQYQPIGQISHGVSIEMELMQAGSEPMGMRCMFCHEDIMTRASYKNTSLTHIIAAVLAIFFWWMCCCVIPYVVKRWKNVEHYCPNCHKFLGVHARTSVL